MPKPSAPAHPGGKNPGWQRGSGIKTRLSCAKKGAEWFPHQTPGWTVGLGLSGVTGSTILVTPDLGTVTHRAPSSSTVPWWWQIYPARPAHPQVTSAISIFLVLKHCFFLLHSSICILQGGAVGAALGVFNPCFPDH